MTQRSLFCHHHPKRSQKRSQVFIIVLIFQLYSRCRSIRWGWNLRECLRIRQGEKIQCRLPEVGIFGNFLILFEKLFMPHSIMFESQWFHRKHIPQSWEAGDMSHRPILCSCFRWGDTFVKLIAEKEAQTKTTTTIITKETLQHMRWWSVQNGTSSPASITKGASPKKELKTCQHDVEGL